MKIITDTVVYVQKNDIAFLNQTDLIIPASIFLKVFGHGITIIDDSNRFDFVKFEEESEIEYFKSLDWIVDYDSVKDLTEEQIIQLGQQIADQKNSIAKKFNSMSVSERIKNNHLVSECEKLEFKMYSLRDIIWFKQGHIDMTLPENVELPTVFKKNKESVVKRLLKKFKNPYKY